MVSRSIDRGESAIRLAPEFEPFPPDLLAALPAIPSPAPYGYELLPLLRWLVAHNAPRLAVLVEDGTGLSAPVLAAALPLDTPLHTVLAGQTVPDGADFVHVTAPMHDGAVAGMVARLAPSGLLLTGPSSLPGGLALAVADGVTLLAGSNPPPLFHWLAPRIDRAALAASFDSWGRQIARVAYLEASAREAEHLRHTQAQAAGQGAASRASADRERDRLRAELARVTAERDAITGSSAWRLTSPLRRTILAAKTRLRPPPAPAQTQGPKEAFRAQAAQGLDNFLLSGERLRLPCSAAPDVSILLVLYNQAPLTYLCLQSIASTLPPAAAIEVVIVDNASGDDTALLLGRVDGAVVLRNPENRHFLHGVNQALAIAKGRDILLLNNDARLRPGALQAAQRTLHSAHDIGAVGAKIILADGTLQEAGSIIWKDGTCAGYGRGDSPTAPQYQFRRDVDFCSGAFLLVRGDLFHGLHGLDPAFGPAYYEEVDLCMRLHGAGYRIVYEPEAEIDHFEFASSATAEDAIGLQRRNQALFGERHAERLYEHHFPPRMNLLFARMRGRKRRILYIDDRVPYPELGSGYPRAARIIRELAADGWFVTFYPAHHPQDDWSDTYAAFPREVEFMLGHGYPELPAFLRERDGLNDTILVSRPHNMAGFLAARGDTNRGARLIYDAEAIFATREFLRLEQAGQFPNAEQRATVLEKEIGLAKTAATITTVNAEEAAIFRSAGHDDVRVLGLGVEPNPIPAGFSGRSGFLFVGGLDRDDSPNTDALAFFVTEIMPLLSHRLGFPATLTVAGRARSARALALAGEHVRILGIVADLTPLYAAARVFIAPHRYAAGLPLKVQESAARGLPTVASALLARQLGWMDGRELLVASDAAAFADACARLHSDAELWLTLRRGALARLTAEVTANEFGATLRGILQPLSGG